MNLITYPRSDSHRRPLPTWSAFLVLFIIAVSCIRPLLGQDASTAAPVGLEAPVALSTEAAVPAPPPPPPVFPKDIADLVSPLLSTGTVTLPLSWFPEHLVFEVKWGFIKAGEATLSSTEKVSMNGRPAYHLVSRANSNKVINAFYTVKDLNESWLDIEKMHSLGYRKRLREGRYIEDTWVVYDIENKRFLSQKIKKDGKVRQTTGPIPDVVQDVLSSLYYIRTLDLKVGGEYTLDVNTGENWPLVVKVHKKTTIHVPLGTYSCFLVQPVLRQPGLFIQKGKDLYVWMTADERKMPVHMEVEVFIGHIAANLVRIQQKPE